jgi:hypothetical protein
MSLLKTHLAGVKCSEVMHVLIVTFKWYTVTHSPHTHEHAFTVLQLNIVDLTTAANAIMNELLTDTATSSSCAHTACASTPTANTVYYENCVQLDVSQLHRAQLISNPQYRNIDEFSPTVTPCKPVYANHAVFIPNEYTHPTTDGHIVQR